MSRNLKRVPMNFFWPIGKPWEGYVNPYEDLAGTCPDCDNGHDRVGGRPDANAALFYAQWYGHAAFDPVAYGAEPLSPYAPAIWRLAGRNVGEPDFYTTHAARIESTNIRFKTGAFDPDDPPFILFPSFDRESAVNREARRLYARWRGQWIHHVIQADVEALVAKERLWDLTSTWSKDGWQPREDGHHPTAAEVNAWSFEGFGHDSFNCGICVEARCLREGVPYLCASCGGTGSVWPTPEIKQQCDSWEQTEPPAGDGYQIWEDCSTGRPISPVFASLEALCAWAADHASTFAHEKATAEEWKQMLEEDFVHATDTQGNIYL